MSKISEKFAQVTRGVQGEVSTLSLIQTVVAMQYSVILNLAASLEDPEAVTAQTRELLDATVAAAEALCGCATEEIASLSAPELLARIDEAYARRGQGIATGVTVH